jgi:hypothetical protein
MKNNKLTIKLITKRFKQFEEFPIGLNFSYLMFGPFAAIKERQFFSAFVIVLLSIPTLGLFWIYYAFQANKIDIRRKLDHGYTLHPDYQTLEIIKILKLKQLDFDRVKLSRLSSMDGKIK